MKGHYYKMAKLRTLQPGHQLLVLLPVSGSSLCAKFYGPYIVENCVTQYIIPGQNWQTPVCQINIVNSYHADDSTAETFDSSPLKTSTLEVIIAGPDPKVAKGSNKH